jgi:hypothetical protein
MPKFNGKKSLAKTLDRSWQSECFLLTLKIKEGYPHFFGVHS